MTGLAVPSIFVSVSVYIYLSVCLVLRPGSVAALNATCLNAQRHSSAGILTTSCTRLTRDYSPISSGRSKRTLTTPRGRWLLGWSQQVRTQATFRFLPWFDRVSPWLCVCISAGIIWIYE